MAGPAIQPILQRITMTGQIAANNFILPANCVLREILVFNTTANAITGGLKFGTTSGATDIAAALAVAASVTAFLTDALMLKRFFSPTTSQQIFFDAVASWNSANVNITILYENLNNG
jgi:hypothetical protein